MGIHWKRNIRRKKENVEKPNDSVVVAGVKSKEEVPPSVSLSAYMKAGQIVSSKKKIVSLVLEEYNVENVTWKDPLPAKFIFYTVNHVILFK